MYLYILVGNVGCGKSTYARTTAEKHSSIVVVNTDWVEVHNRLKAEYERPTNSEGLNCISACGRG